MFNAIRSQFNSLPSVVTAILVGLFVSWLVASAALPPGQSAPPPTITLTVNSQTNPVNVRSGSTITLSWTTKNSVSCSASDDWSGSKATSGSETKTNITSHKTYTLACSGDGGTTKQSINVNPIAVDLKANGSDGPLFVQKGTAVTLSWTFSGASWCDASWDGRKNYDPRSTTTSGSESSGSLASSQTLTLSCTTNVGGGNITDSVAVNVLPPVVGVGLPPPPPPFFPIDCITDPALVKNGLNLAGIYVPPKAPPPLENVNLTSLMETSDLAQAKTGCLGAVSHLIAGNLALNASNGYANALLVPFGKVGIGTSTPAATLDVEGDVKAWGALQSLSFGNFYTAQTDGLVLASIHADNDGDKCSVNAVSGGVGMGGASAHDYSGSDTHVPYASLTFPVWRGSMWKVDLTNVSGTCSGAVLFFPLGKGTSTPPPPPPPSPLTVPTAIPPSIIVPPSVLPTVPPPVVNPGNLITPNTIISPTTLPPSGLIR